MSRSISSPHHGRSRARRRDGRSPPAARARRARPASTGQQTQAQLREAQRDAVRFARCMRSHGVPNLPDPTSPAEFKSIVVGKQDLPAFQSAASTCRRLLPGGGPPSQSAARTRAQIVAALAFARCLRTHGFPSFPDPSSSGELSHEMLANAGIDIHQPAAVRAADACVGVTHGLITRAAGGPLRRRPIAGRPAANVVCADISLEIDPGRGSSMSDRIWFITGASRGFGRSFTQAALAAGDASPPPRETRRRWTSSSPSTATPSCPSNSTSPIAMPPLRPFGRPTIAWGVST